MISPVDLVKRVCVGGRLVPFFKCVGVYFVSAGGGGGGGGSPGAACVKCAPVACLVVLVALHVHHLPTQQCAEVGSVYSLRRLSSRACSSASASEGPAPPPPPATAAAAAGVRPAAVE